jgi:hypothetical protein
MKTGMNCLAILTSLAFAQIGFAQPATQSAPQAQLNGNATVNGGRIMITHGGEGGAQPLNITGTITALTPGMNQKMEKGPFMGVVTDSASGELRANLNLPNGVGLVVKSIEPGSPAEKAGLEKYDIIQKFNDQLLVNPQQLGILVRLQKPGDDVSLSILHKGQPTTLPVKLIEKMIPANNEDFLYSTWGGNNHATFTPNSGVFQLQANNEPFQNAINLIAKRTQSSNAAIVYDDSKHTLEITRHDNVRHLLAKDPSGKVLFDGPIDTKEQRSAIPAEVADALKVIEDRMDELGVKDDGSVQLRIVRPPENPTATSPAPAPAPAR